MTSPPTPPVRRTSCADALMRLMRAYDIEVVFSIPGVHTIEFYRSFPERGLRHVTPRHEQGAAMMAYGYGFATGRPACCMLITGPGLVNAATGIAEGTADSIPMLVIAANNLVSEIGVGRGALHETRSQFAIEEQVAGFAHQLLDPANAPEIMHRAMSLMQAARPRPAIIEIPRDLLAAPVELVEHARPAVAPPAPEPTALAAAAELLKAARRPLIIAGGGARHAAAELRGLAEAQALPVVTTTAGKGILPEDHPLALGGTLPFRPVQDRIAAADAVLAIGTELGETDLLYTGRSYAFAPGALIRVDIDPRQLTMNHHPGIALVSDAAAAARALAQAMEPDATPETRAEREREVAALRAALKGQWSAEADRHKLILDAMAGVLDADALICADSTQIAYTGSHYYPSRRPGCWLFPSGYGTLGTALPAAIGARLGCPERQAVALAGDGSLLYTLPELATAVENRLGLPVIVWNNRAYGEIRDAMQGAQIPTIGVDLQTPDFVTIARGFGCEGVLIESVEQFRGALRASFDLDRPTLLQIDSDAPFLG